MKLGFSGARVGLTGYQNDHLYSFLMKHRAAITEVHHGDCVGADFQFHQFCREMGIGKIIGHPPVDGRLRALTACDVELPPLPYLQRNRAIVDACDLLVACPPTSSEQQRGGTWTTVRYARYAGKPSHIIQPNGYARMLEKAGA